MGADRDGFFVLVLCGHAAVEVEEGFGKRHGLVASIVSLCRAYDIP